MKHGSLIVALCIRICLSVNPTSSPTVVPSVLPTVRPTSSPSVKPSYSPTRVPTAQPSPDPTTANPYYLVESIYEGITCGAVDYSVPIQQTGYIMGECIVQYSTEGIAVSSLSYDSNCIVNNQNNFEIVTSYYADTLCSVFTLQSTSTVSAECSTTGDYTSKNICGSYSEPPFTQLKGGYVSGYSITLDDCKNDAILTYVWYQVNECQVYTENDDAIDAFKRQCYSDTSSDITLYSDTECISRIETTKTTFDQCSLEENVQTEFGGELYFAYKYGVCQDKTSTSSNDDEVTLTSSEYAGEIVGVLIAGAVVGGLIGFAILYFCCASSIAKLGQTGQQSEAVKD